MKKSLSVLLIWLLAVFSSVPVSAELWAPVGEATWYDGIMGAHRDMPYFKNKSWKVTVEQSVEHPNAYRMQPYSNHPLSVQSGEYHKDNVWVYLHIENNNRIYIENFAYKGYYSNAWGTYYIKQRCPENGFDNLYYGHLAGNSIEFQPGSFEIRYSENGTPTYTTEIHKIVFPEGVIGSNPVLETWINIGLGKWEEGILRNSYNDIPSSWDVTLEKSSTRQDVYRLFPYASDGAEAYFGVIDQSPIYLHVQSDNRIYIEPYTIGGIKIRQKCNENSWTGQQSYSHVDNGRIEFPFTYFSVDKGADATFNTTEATTVITLPGGYDKPIEDDYGIFLGLTAFNQEVKNKPISPLNASTKGEFMDFINSMETKIGTLLYYSVDQAISTLKAQTYPKNLNNVVLVTFTDGLDQGSLALAPEHRTSLNYANYLSELIANTTIEKIPLQAYSIGLKGSDVRDDELFMTNLQSLASVPEKAMTVNDIANVEAELNRIVDDLARTSVETMITVSLPMLSDGDKVRFTLDNSSADINSSSQWIEVTFSIDKMAFTDITYNGMTCGSGETIAAIPNGIFLDLIFEDCRTLDGESLGTKKEDIDQWTYIQSKDFWQPNSEINKDQQIKVEEIHNSTALMFALDCSSSLGDKFPALKQAAISFIEKLADGQNQGQSGISDITTDKHVSDNDKIEYYNLQGIKIENPTKGLYIRRCGNKTDKIIL